MTAHEYLSRIRDFDAKISNLNDEINSLYMQMSGISSPAWDERVQTSGSLASPQEKLLPKYIKTLHTQQNTVNRYLKLRKKIVDQINDMDDWRYTRVLYLTYIKGMHAPEIADEMGYVPEWIRQMRQQALIEFERKFLRNLTPDM